MISHEEISENEVIFQKYKIGAEPNEQNGLIFVDEINFSYNRNSVPNQIASLPYFAESSDVFLNVIDMKKVNLSNHLPAEPYFLAEPYT